MFDRELLNQITGYIQSARDPLRSRAVQLENRVFAMIVVLQALIGGIESLQRFYDDADIATLISAASASEPIEADGTLRKSALVKYLAMIVSLRTWLTTPISEQITETPRQLLSRRPSRITD